MTDGEKVCPACGKPTLKFFNRIGRYRCIDADCGEDFAVDQIKPPAAPPAPDTDFLEDLPFPVAYPLAHARDTRLSARDRVANAIFGSYQAMRATALLLLADYLACDTVCRQLQGPIRGLRLPHWGEWSLLCDRLCQFWSARLQERPERDTHFPHLVAGWLEINRQGRLPKKHSWVELLADFPGLQHEVAWSPNDALWRARNERAHREATRTVDEGAEREILPRLLPVAETFAGRLFPPGALVLWRRVAGADGAICLQGPHVDLRFEVDEGAEAAALNWGASGLLARTPTTDLTVYPLFVPLDPERAGQLLAGGGLVEPVGLVDGIGEKKVAVLGVRSHCELPELAGPIQVALNRKEVQLGFDRAQTRRWSLVSWSTVTAADMLNALRGRKYFPEVYLERATADGLVRAALEPSGRGLLLLGEAGAGKSSLLARLVDRLLAADRADDEAPPCAVPRQGAGDVVLFLSGAESYKGDAAWSGRQALCEAVLRRAGIASGTFADLDDLCRQLEATAKDDLEADRRVWLILDALNEADRFTDLLRALDEFLPALERHPWLRLLVSLRTGAYQSLAQRHRDLLQHGSEVLANARCLARFKDARNQEVPYLELQPFSTKEAAAAFGLRQRHRPEQSCPVPHDLLEPSLRELLRAPLYLHLFHETFRGFAEPPQELDESRLLAAYLDRLETELPGIAGHLQRLGRLMYERRIPLLPVAEADTWVAEWRARLGLDSALRMVKLDPLEELVAASLLMRPAEEGEGAERRLTGYGFTQQRLCEQVLARELRRQIHPRILPKADELFAWARQAAGPDVGAADDFQELTGALEIITAELALAGQGRVLIALLDLEGETVRTRLLGSALRALGPTGRSNLTAVEGVLAPLIERARNDVIQGGRFEASVWQAQRWLTKHAFSPVAARIAQGRLSILRALVAQEPGRADWRRDLAVTLGNLGRLAQAAGDGTTAQTYFEESLEIRRVLVAQEPGRADRRRELAVALGNLGRLAQAAGNSAAAQTYFGESLEIRRVLVAQEPGRADRRRSLAVALCHLGQFAQAGNDRTAAQTYFQEDLEISRALVAQEPGRADWRRDLAVTLGNLGRLAQAAGDRPAAQTCFEESLEIARALVAQEPGRADWRQDLAVAFGNLGELTQAAGDSAAAQTYFEESLGLLRALVAQEPGRADLRRELAVAFNYLGRLAQAAGDSAAARTYFEKSLEIRRTLTIQDPASTDWRVDLAMSYWDLYRVVPPSDQRPLLEKVLETLRPLQEGGLPHRQWDQLWGLATKAFSDLGDGR